LNRFFYLGLYEDFMVVSNDYNKIQINKTIDKNMQGEITHQSIMLNIRAESTEEAVTLYKELKDRLNGNITATKITQKEINTENHVCDKCGKQMMIRKSKKGESFWGCSGYPNCRFTLPYTNNANAKQEVINVEEIPF